MSQTVHADAAWLGGQTLERDVTLLVDEGGFRRVDDDTSAIHVEGVVLPGLVDHHVHTELIELKPLLRNGITAVHDLGAPPSVFALEGPDIPRVLAVGPFLTTAGGYPVGRPWVSEGMVVELDEFRAPAKVCELVAAGAVAIKLSLNANSGPPTDEETVAAIVRVAHAEGLPVIAHAEGTGQFVRALQHGIDELAHTPWTERLSGQLVSAMGPRMTWVSTVDIHNGPDADLAIDNLRRFHTAGGKVRYGTDLGNGPLPLGVNVAELDALVEAGVAPVPAIATDTQALSVVPSDPLADHRALLNAAPLTDFLPL